MAKPDERTEGLAGWLAARERTLFLLVTGGFFLAGLAWGTVRGIGADENFYASAAWLVAHGATPYVDFLFPQGPLSAYVYAPAFLLGLDPYAGRVVSLLLGAATVALTWAVGRRLGGPFAGVVAGATIGASVPLLSATTLVSAISLCAFLVAAMAFVLTSRVPPVPRYAAAGVLLALAAGARVNLVVGAPLLVGLAFLGAPRGQRRGAGLATLGAFSVVLLAQYLPFLLLAPESTWFSLVGYHVLDAKDPSLGALQLLKYKLDGFHYFVAGFAFPLTAVALGVVFLRRHRAHLPAFVRQHPLETFFALFSLVAIGVTMVKVYVQPHYLLVVLPLLAVLSGLLLARLARRGRDPFLRDALVAFAALFLLLHAAGQVPPYVARPPPDESLATYEGVADLLAIHLPPGGEVLTLLPLAAETAGHRPVPGAEMGLFGYLPSWPEEEADAVRGLTASRVLDLVSSGGPGAVVIRDTDFLETTFPTARLGPEEEAAFVTALGESLAANYAEIAVFGEGDRAVHVWLRTDLAPTAGSA